MAGKFGNGDQPLSSIVYIAPLELKEKGSGLQWIYIPAPGTYTFHCSASLGYEVYRDSDISTPLERIDQLSTSDIPQSLSLPYTRYAEKLDPIGQTFASRTPLLIAVQRIHDTPADTFFMVLEHRGESLATAIRLQPSKETTVPFPLGQYLGKEDSAWFRVTPPATLMGAERDEQIILINGDGNSGSLDIVDLSGQNLLTNSITGGDMLAQKYTVGITDDFYVRVRRDADTMVGQVLYWDTPVSYIKLDEVFTIHITDETGLDLAGADEPTAYIGLDGKELLSTHWDDADSGEDWPGLVGLVRVAAVARGGNERSIAFTQYLYVAINEPDAPFGFAHGGLDEVSISALEPGKEEGPRSCAIEVYDSIKNGTYTVRCTLSRDP